jgi:drug/metabolite transporter (DMT)-like permease
VQERENMDEKARFRRFVGIVIAVLVAGALFVIVFANSSVDNWATMLSVAILVTMAAVAIIVARKKRKELKSGVPSEDERSTAIRMRAGYLAFYISLYFIFGMSFFHAILEDNQVSSPPTSEWLMIYVAAMGSIFLVLNAYLTRKGVPG